MKRHRRREATPVAHMILSKRMADHRPHDMVCELVDNAFDAEAGRVWIELGRRGVTVADDGTGMEDINDAIRFGKGTRAARRGGVLGRYGVGMTDALCKLGPKAEVATLREGGLRRLRVERFPVERQGEIVAYRHFWPIQGIRRQPRDIAKARLYGLPGCRRWLLASRGIDQDPPFRGHRCAL